MTEHSGIQWDQTRYKYEQIAHIIGERIRSGVYPPQTVLSEVAFEQEFDVARPTVRKAMSILRASGLVVTLRGKGSIVTGPKAGQTDSGDVLD